VTIPRILTAAVLIPVVVCAVLYGNVSLVAVVIASVMLLALREFFALGVQAGMTGHALWTSLCALLLLGAQYLETRQTSHQLAGGWTLLREPGLSGALLDLAVVLFVVGAAGLSLLQEGSINTIFPAISISSAGMLLIAAPLSYLVRLHGIERIGPWLLLFVLVLVWVGDTLAYFVGRQFGRTPMAPRLSPKKTWEGAAANLAGSLMVAPAFVRVTGLDITHLLAMAALGNVAGQLGDLTESAYKRAAGAKDSSSLLPGHGGVLDRIDSLILAAPVVWYYFRMVVERRG
jgi:phosphatidate cytidylyltransferase